MAHFSIIISFVSIIGLLLSVVSPQKSLFWYSGRKNRRKGLLLYSVLLVLSFLIFALTEGLANT